jgi:hypothetical protein
MPNELSVARSFFEIHRSIVVHRHDEAHLLNIAASAVEAPQIVGRLVFG